ncbi:hypothetical protein BDU57DRAFT_344584 [Ampelomyces quisqualis]|uniref:Uncharacterized protein n=1 Tax=Ampelomyces quisqualis TaxID=50730 RepID=A0A6A5QE66_AMPQU|nr:hypothetical protein BDU57DRAFT_344584 [Ampelomyces quisqualis]
MTAANPSNRNPVGSVNHVWNILAFYLALASFVFTAVASTAPVMCLLTGYHLETIAQPHSNLLQFLRNFLFWYCLELCIFCWYRFPAHQLTLSALGVVLQ